MRVRCVMRFVDTLCGKAPKDPERLRQAVMKRAKANSAVKVREIFSGVSRSPISSTAYLPVRPGRVPPDLSP